jgi:hypothetical protein
MAAFEHGDTVRLREEWRGLGSGAILTVRCDAWNEAPGFVPVHKVGEPGLRRYARPDMLETVGVTGEVSDDE